MVVTLMVINYIEHSKSYPTGIFVMFCIIN